MNKLFQIGCGLLLTIFLAGCWNLLERDISRKFEQSLRHYSAALRWARENNASTYIKSRETGKGNPTIFFDKNIQVTDYDTVSVEYAVDMKQAIVTSKLTYYTLDTASVKVQSDRQLWWYDADAGGWYIDGEIPSILLTENNFE